MRDGTGEVVLNLNLNNLNNFVEFFKFEGFCLLRGVKGIWIEYYVDRGEIR